MKKIYALILMLIMTTAFIGGCGKPSAKEAYKYVVEVPYGTSLEDVRDELGEETKSHNVIFNKNTGSITLGTFTWNYDDSEYKWIQIGIGSNKFASVRVSNELLREIAKGKNLICKRDIPQKSHNKVSSHMEYNEVRDFTGCEGLVKARSKRDEQYSGGSSTTFIWFDSQGKNFQVKFDDYDLKRNR